MNRPQDEYTEKLGRSFKQNFMRMKLILLNDAIDQDFHKKIISMTLKGMIVISSSLFGLFKVGNRYPQYFPQNRPAKFFIITISGLAFAEFFLGWLKSDVEYREMISILAQRYEQQLIQLDPSLKEAKIKCSFPGQPGLQGNFRDLPYTNPNNYQSNYGNNYNQSIRQPSFNPENYQNYQQSNLSPEQTFQQPNVSTENGQSYQQPNFRTPNGNPQPYSNQPSNFNAEMSNHQLNSYQPNTINKNPQPYNYEQTNFNSSNTAQLNQQSNFNAHDNTAPSQSSLNYPPPNWQNKNSWNNERESTHKGTEFSDKRNKLSSQSAKPAQLNPNENPNIPKEWSI